MSRATVNKILVMMGAAAFIWFGHGAKAATFTVNTTADTNDVSAGNGVCADASGQCSLRAAISEANLTADADTINLPAGIYRLTIVNSGGVNEDNNATGDLDINSSMTIQGAGASATFIQAGTNTSDGIDKVFGVNPFCSNGVNVTISDVTIRYGRNTQPYGAADFSYTGGGLDWCGGTGTESFTLSNSVVSDNTNVNGYGGGLNIDSYTGYTGDITITNVTFQNNQSQINRAGNIWGGGAIHIKGYRPDVIIANSTFTNNSIVDPDSAGGAIYYGPGYGGSLTVHGSTFTNNTAPWGGGVGIYHLVSPTVGSPTVTIDQNTQIANNTATSGGGGIYIGGDYLNGTFLLSGLRVLQNTAPEGGGIYVQRANATVRYSRIVDNHATAGTGTGLYKDNNAATVTAINNWWGCSTGPGAAPCDTAVIAGGSSGSLTSAPYLQLRTSATPSTLAINGSATITAGFALNSAGTDVSANIGRLKDLPVTWSAVLGSLSGQQTAIQANGTATATYTPTSVGSGQVAAVVDNDTTTASRPNVAAITVNKTATTTSVSSSANPSSLGQSVTFTATVSPAPTGGTVAFKDNGAVIGGCGTQALTAGQATCSTSALVLGTHAITAEYGGTAAYDNSTGTLAPDQQITCLSTITVANNADSGAGSLRQAVADVCAGGTIIFDPSLSGQTITLTGGQLSIAKSMTIYGAGVFVSGGNAVRVFYVSAGTVTINNLTIQNGRNVPSIASGLGGSGLYVTNAGTAVTLNNCAVLNNATNASPTVGGGIVADTGTVLTMNNCTVSGNSSTFDSGGILNLGTLNANNCSIVNNTTPGWGGGLETTTSSVTLRNTILAGNSGSSGADCYTPAGTIQSAGYNMIGSTSNCTIVTSFGDVTGFSYASLLLGPLQNNGGPNSTYALLPGSPAIDAIPGCNGAPATDQRGVSRPQGAACDIGAYEALLLSTTISLSSAPNPAAYGHSVTFIATVTGGAVTPTGTVEFRDDGATIPGCGSTALDGGGQAACTEAALTAGTHSITAFYSGAASFSASDNSASPLSQQVVMLSPPAITAAFGATPITVNGATSLSFNLANPEANSHSLTGVGFTATLPAGLMVASPNGASNNCGGTATAVAASGSISLSGATLAAAGSCTYSVNVTGSTAGSFNVATGNVSALESGSGGTASASLVIAPTLGATAVVMDPAVPGTLYAAQDGGGIWKSTDGGATWTAATTQPANQRVKGLVIHPATRSTLFAATYGGGVYTSTDSGVTWNHCANDGLNGASLNTVSLAMDPSGRLYVGTEGGIFTSSDSGSIWSAVNTNLTVEASTPPVTLAVAPATPATIYAGLDGAGVFVSTNSGGSWTPATTQPGDLHVKRLVIKPNDDTKLYAATIGGGVFYSTDSGVNWSACANTNLTNLNVVSLTIDGNGKLYAGSEVGVFVSTDGCATWNAMNGGLP